MVNAQCLTAQCSMLTRAGHHWVQVRAAGFQPSHQRPQWSQRSQRSQQFSNGQVACSGPAASVLPSLPQLPPVIFLKYFYYDFGGGLCSNGITIPLPSKLSAYGPYRSEPFCPKSIDLITNAIHSCILFSLLRNCKLKGSSISARRATTVGYDSM